MENLEKFLVLAKLNNAEISFVYGGVQLGLV